MASHFRILPPKRTLILFAILFLPFLADSVWTAWKYYQWTRSSALSLYSLGYMRCPKDLSICSSDDRFPLENTIRISAGTNLGYSSTLEYHKESGGIRFRVFRISSSFFFPRKNQSCFRIADPVQEKEIWQFIQTHERELTDSDFQQAVRDFIARYKDELRKIGNGDFRLGLERAGVAEWIKEGKDPETEWAKKFPADRGTQQK